MSARWIIGIVMAWSIGVGAGGSSAAVVNQIVGAAANGPPPLNIPLTFSINCVISCPQSIAPSFTEEDRVWGGTTVCRTSVDRGATWANCAGALPVTFPSPVQVAEDINGVVFVAGRPDADTPASCVIYRSTDTGATWSLVYSAARFCSFAGGEADSNHMMCAANGVCGFLFRNSVTSEPTFIWTNTQGASWTTVTGAVGGGAIQTAAFNGNNGGGYSAGGLILNTVISGLNVASVTLPTGYSCWGSFIRSDQAFTACHNNTQAAIFDGITGGLQQVTSFPGAVLVAGTGVLMTNFNDLALYAVAPIAGADDGVYVSIDNGVSWVQLFTYNHPVRRGGTTFTHPVNGCVYLSRTTKVLGLCPS